MREGATYPGTSVAPSWWYRLAMDVGDVLLIFRSLVYFADLPGRAVSAEFNTQAPLSYLWWVPFLSSMVIAFCPYSSYEYEGWCMYSSYITIYIVVVL